MNPFALPVGQYRFVFKAIEDISLPAYSGSAWRGLFGHALKQSVCLSGMRQCDDCLLKSSCVYRYLYETHPPQDAAMMKRYPQVPHPYVMNPLENQPRLVASGQSLSLDMSLIGKANQHFPYIVHAFNQAGERGIGKGRSRFATTCVQQWHDEQWKTIYSPKTSLEAYPYDQPAHNEAHPKSVRVELMTPFRFKSYGRYVSPKNFAFYPFLSSVLRRVSAMRCFHTDTPLDVDFAALTQQAKQTHLLKQNVTWFDWQRFSSRQDRAVKMGGVVGSFTLDEKATETFWPLLSVGQTVNAGKGCVMGLGKYRLVADD